jgi:L-ascorbate metabolism protein UlaG (beta-lactamase superfamily)
MLFPRFEPEAEIRLPSRAPPIEKGGSTRSPLRVQWLGTAGFTIASERCTVMVDPYLSRLSLMKLAGSPLIPDEKAIRARLPTRVDAVICGHSHFDHLLDAPIIARMTGAKLIGSRTTCAFGLAAGLDPAQLVEIGAHGGEFPIGDLAIRFVPSLHAKLVFGRVPLAGEVASPAPSPARVWQYRMGGAFGVLVRAPGATLYHNGSADLVDASLAGLRADVLLIGIVGRKHAPDYVTRLLRLLRPSVIVPAHHDAFFAPLEDGVRLLPGVDIAGFVAEIRRERPDVQIAAPFYDEIMAFDASTGRALLVD